MNNADVSIMMALWSCSDRTPRQFETERRENEVKHELKSAGERKNRSWATFFCAHFTPVWQFSKIN
jgi:hypothetical protein